MQKQGGCSYGKSMAKPAIAAAILGIITISNYRRINLIKPAIEDDQSEAFPTIGSKGSGLIPKLKPFSHYVDKFRYILYELGSLDLNLQVKQQLGGGATFASNHSNLSGYIAMLRDLSRVVDSAKADKDGPNSLSAEEGKEVVNENDLEHFLHLLEGKDGDASWQSLLEHSMPNMAVQSWFQEPEAGPVIYKSRTVYEDATPEMVRDFFWDDEFRPQWNPVLSYLKILEECPQTGLMIVHWIKKVCWYHLSAMLRPNMLLEAHIGDLFPDVSTCSFNMKFPLFYSDREYIIGRRIWESGKTYYCITKGVPYPSMSKRENPRRVDQYFSSWIVRPVESCNGDGQLSACEVIVVHYEETGVPKNVAKLGIRHGLLGTMRRVHSGLRAYQEWRKSETSISKCAHLATITTKMSSVEVAASEVPPFI